jgi:hypothetical protein
MTAAPRDAARRQRELALAARLHARFDRMPSEDAVAQLCYTLARVLVRRRDARSEADKPAMHGWA